MTDSQIIRSDDIFPSSMAQAVCPGADPAERALIYRWLAGLFAREITFETLTAYRSEEGRALLEGLAEFPALVPVVEEISLWMNDASDEDLKIIAMELRGEFAKLFVGVAGRRTAPPYRSFYTSEKGRLMQGPAASMQQMLRQLDISVSDQFPEPPDHIAVQLSVMATYVDSADAQDQAAFLDGQLLDWLEMFRDRCADAAPYGFYTTVATALIGFAHADRKTLFT